jgi:hypothetical protein
MNLNHIAEGWAKHLDIIEVSEQQKQLAKERVEICVKCEHAKEQWLSKFIDGVLKKDIQGSGIGCGVCGCPVNQKALVTDEVCPKNKW